MFRLLVLLFSCSLMFADVEDHFKKAVGKSYMHCMGNIDFIYMINLDQRPEKFALSQERLAPYGIYPYRFSAVNGWQLTLEEINDVGVKYESWMTTGTFGTFYREFEPEHEVVQVIGKNYFCHCMSRGAIGIVLSHLSILQDAYDSGYETIWVMEDDIRVIRDPRILPDLIDELDDLVGKEGWDILFTDRDTVNNSGVNVPCTAFAWRPNFTPSDPYKFQLREEISPHLRRIGARYGAYSMIVRRSGIKKLLDFFKNYSIFLPFDMDFTLPPTIQMFTVIEDVVSTQINAPTDNGAPNYKNNKVGDSS